MNELMLYGAICYSLIVVGIVLTACELRRSNAACRTALLNGSGGLTNAGTLQVNGGILTESGAYTRSASRALDISIDGTTAGKTYDQVNPSTASLNGTLNITDIKGFVPTVDTTFKILNYTSETGTFATVNGLSINGSEHYAMRSPSRGFPFANAENDPRYG